MCDVWVISYGTLGVCHMWKHFLKKGGRGTLGGTIGGELHKGEDICRGGFKPWSSPCQRCHSSNPPTPAPPPPDFFKTDGNGRSESFCKKKGGGGVGKMGGGCLEMGGVAILY